MRNYLLRSNLPDLWIPYLWIFNALDFVLMITWKLIETNSQSFWEYGHYWIILPFLSCLLFFSFLFFLALSKEVDYNAKENSLPHMSYISINQSTISFFYQTLFVKKVVNHLKVLITFTNKANSSFWG